MSPICASRRTEQDFQSYVINAQITPKQCTKIAEAYSKTISSGNACQSVMWHHCDLSGHTKSPIYTQHQNDDLRRVSKQILQPLSLDITVSPNTSVHHCHQIWQLNSPICKQKWSNAQRMPRNANAYYITILSFKAYNFTSTHHHTKTTYDECHIFSFTFVI